MVTPMLKPLHTTLEFALFDHNRDAESKGIHCIYSYNPQKCLTVMGELMKHYTIGLNMVNY